MNSNNMGLCKMTAHPDQKFGCVTYAQHGDDLMILNLFDLMGIQLPTYLDLGAHHPETISNTKLLYDRGSRGINVEANPNLFKAFKSERPGDVNLNIGIGIAPGNLPFYMYDDWSGRNTFSLEETIVFGRPVTKTLMVDVWTLDAVVNTYGGKFPELLTLDLEGLDFEVLSAANFKKSAPLVIVVEVRRTETAKFVHLLREKGFIFHSRMGENVFFVRADYFARTY